jgi:quinol-cytochrome oxidoreductase complex cytochrome b subunit
LILVFALIPLLDKAKEPQHYISNPLHRPFMTALGITGGVFLTMLIVSGYIDVLKINPRTMIKYVIIATAAAWIISYLLLKIYNKNKNGGENG